LLELYGLGKTPEGVQNDWKLLKDIGLSRGSYLHKLLETRELGLDDPDVKTFINSNIKQEIDRQSEFANRPWDNEYTLLTETYEKIYSLALLFLEENKHLEAIEIERLVGDETINLAGTFDRLYYNSNSNQFEIWDFKTDKKINYSNKYSKLSIFNLDDCEYNKYSLQTSLYKYIIEKNTPVVLGDSYIVHFSHENNKYETIKAEDYTKLIKEKFEDEYNRPTYL
jgi:hypothetical protein